MAILFLKDWNYYPTARPNLETSNQSFFEVARMYRDMGIQNHAFPLALVNQTLKDIDPFDPRISKENQLKIALECKINPWYYFREIARVPGDSGDDAIPLRANRGNIALFWSFFNHITTYLIQIRQTGKSLSLDELLTYLLNIRCQSTTINLLTKDEKLRIENITRMKRIDEELPFYLRQRTANDPNNTEFIGIGSLRNRLIAHLPQASPKAANNIGRGFTSPILVVDESPFQVNIDISVPAAAAAGTAARDRAKKNNEPYGTIFTTTTGKKDEKSGKFIYDQVDKAMPWTEAIFDCKNEIELEQTVTTNSRGKDYAVNITMNHIQLGYSDEWLVRAIKNTIGITPDQADRDYFNRWTSGTSSNPLPTEVLETIKKSEKEPQYNEISTVGSYILRWFIKEDKIYPTMLNDDFVMTVDSSDASGGDDISLLITSIKSGEVVASGTYNETNLITFAEWLAQLLSKFPRLTAMIERRSSGVAIIDYLLMILPSRGLDPFKRIFNWGVNNKEENEELYKVIEIPMSRRPSNFYTVNKKLFGFATSATGVTSRSELYSTTLMSAAKHTGDVVKDKRTIDQILSLIQKDGRVDHPPGEHDDMVIAWLLGHWFLTKGKNLQFYGIDSSMILLHRKESSIQQHTNKFDYQQQIQLRKEFEELANKLKEERNIFIAEKYENQLRYLASKIVLQQTEKLSVEDLIKATREDKAKHAASRRNDFIYNQGYKQNDRMVIDNSQMTKYTVNGFNDPTVSYY